MRPILSLAVPEVSIIVINYNTKDLLLGCLNSVFNKVKTSGCLVTVVDNGSSDGSIEAVRQYYPTAEIIRLERNIGFAGAVNAGLRDRPAKYYFILNSDILLTERSLESLVRFMDANPRAGIITGQLLNQDGSRQHSFDNIPGLESELLGKSLLRILAPGRYPSKRQAYSSPIEVESVIGAAMMVREEAIKEVGMLDENYFLFLEETDWCRRMTGKGCQVWFVPESGIYHIQGQSKKKIVVAAKIEYLNSLYKFYRKHHALWIYLVFRLLKPIKIILGFALNLAGCILTFCLVRRIRQMLVVYFALLWWHLMLCPEWATLKGRSQKI
ncbi:MAG: glycosyltransferase family 2 protein [Candidatus Brocadiia bacterium]